PRSSSEERSDADEWMFEIVLDYGDHGADPRPAASAAWSCRTDPFSSYRAGFETRSYRLCQRILTFHHFDSEPGVGRDCLVRSLDLTYAPDGVATKLIGVRAKGYRRDGGGYVSLGL